MTRSTIAYGILIIFFLILFPPAAASGVTSQHPFLLFHDITTVPGYQYRMVDPWHSWENSIISNADTALRRDFSGSLGNYDRVSYRGSFAENLGMAYQITRKGEYAAKAKEALQNMDVGTVAEKVDLANALGSYCLAYDFIQPTLSSGEDMTIRDKLATLADRVYLDLNDDGTNPKYIAFYDYHGQAYPMVGIAGAALYDFKNPNGLALNSTPADWEKVGKEYLFENDKLHYYNRSLFSFGFDEVSGKALNGAYKCYVIDNLPLWFQVYYHAYGENLLDLYPAAKKAMMSEVWDSLPNHYSGNYVTLGDTGWTYGKSILSLLSDNERAEVLNHLDRIEGSRLLPYSRMFDGGSEVLLYSVYGNYAGAPRAYPDTTSYLNPDSIVQDFRGSWKDDADWLSLITFNVNSTSNRDTMHHDQLSFEYYSRGDLLLADAGEIREVLDMNYGGYDVYHNTIAIEDPRTPFPVSPWSGSASAGIYKGDDKGMVTMVTVGSVIDRPWMQLVDANATITTLNTLAYGHRQNLSTPIRYERAILYPDNDYFIIIDRLEGTEPWIYRNIFRPSSLSIVTTTGYSDADVGHVKGDLMIGSSPYNWQGLQYEKETATGITTNTLTWTTSNPYGNAVRLDLVTAPASEVLIEKNSGRLGGYNYESEVYVPVVYFRSPAADSGYRVTALLSRYPSETARTAGEIAVNGIGHALKVQSTGSTDYIYTGTGDSSFAGYSTDADTAFIRNTGSSTEVTLLNGSRIDYQGKPLVTLTKKAYSVSVKKDGDGVKYSVSGDEDLRGELLGTTLDPVEILVPLSERGNAAGQESQVQTSTGSRSTSSTSERGTTTPAATQAPLSPAIVCAAIPIAGALRRCLASIH